jgi:hypothetical protein
MTSTDLEYNDIIKHIITNSLFTERQIYILYNKASGKSAPEGISKGAYYRQFKQSARKTIGVIYSLIILRYLNMIDEGTFSTIEAILNSISHFKEGMECDMSSRDSHDVISLLDEIVRKTSLSK